MASTILALPSLHAAHSFKLTSSSVSVGPQSTLLLNPTTITNRTLSQRGQKVFKAVRVGRKVVCMATHEEEKQGPLRFLRFAAGAGAATAAIGAAAWAVRKHGEEGSHQTIEEAIAAGAPPSCSGWDLMQKVRIVGAPAAAGGRMLGSAVNYLQASVFQWTYNSTVVCLSAILCCIIISGAPPQAAAGGIGEGGSRGYTVQKGDTLTKIADRLGAPVHVIMEANRLRDDTVYAGQQLWVPKTYTIRPGDTLSKIARKFETSIDVLSKLNGIRDADKIFADDILLLP